MKFLKNILSAVGLIVIAGLLIQAVLAPDKEIISSLSASKVTSSPDTIPISNKVVGSYTIQAIPIPENLNFAGEKIPINNPDIRKRLDREMLVNTYWQSNGLLLFKRANEFFPVIEPILKENGIPDDFKYLAVAESALENVVSPAGAAGFWQFMKGSGKDYGLEVNTNVDERYNLVKSTVAAAEYLKKAKAKFGSWTLAAAAYNAGSAGISREQNRQEALDYYDLLLNPETSRYIFRILAIKEIMENPYKYGFSFEENDLYQPIPTYKLEVDTPVTSFVEFSRKYGINYKILKIHNPWLRENHLNNKSGKKYIIEIPEKGYYQ